MWVRRAAIRPVPPYARVPEQVLERVEKSLTASEEQGRDLFSEKFAIFEQSQPILAARVTSLLAKPMGETPLALGYFLSLTVWMSFDESFGFQVQQVDEEEISAAEEILQADEELREESLDETLETDDVIAMQQPALVDFIRDHIDIALEADPIGVDVDEIDSVYRMVLLLVMTLSYAVIPLVTSGNSDGGEWQA